METKGAFMVFLCTLFDTVRVKHLAQCLAGKGWGVLNESLFIILSKCNTLSFYFLIFKIYLIK